MTIEDVWPLFGIELRTPRLVLRPGRDEDIPGLVDAARAGIHDPAVMPFSMPWTDAEPEVLARELARWQWTCRSGVRAESWTVLFTVSLDGVPIGVQDLAAYAFALRKTVNTGSWLTQSAQGKGLGKEMRSAVLQFAFDHLGAERAQSGAAVWNASSLGVSRSLGYTDNGIDHVRGRPGETEDMQRMLLKRDAFVRPEWTLDVRGFGASARAQLGA